MGADQPPSAQLVEKVRLGDHEALGVLYNRHARLVSSLAVRILRDRAEAEDVAQEVFLQIWTQAARFDPLRGTWLAWLQTIARTRALDRLRRRACRREESGCRVPAVTAAPRPERELALRAALQRLPPAQRRALELAYYEGFSQSEIARRLERPLGTVKSWIRCALLDLRCVLAPIER